LVEIAMRLPLFLLCAALLPACSRPPATETAAPPATVRTHRISQLDTQFREFPGLISAHRSADVAFEVGGVVAEVLADTGSRVTSGQALARLDARDFESRRLAAQADADRTRIDLQRGEGLLAEQAIAPARVDAFRAAADAARSTLEQATKAVDDTTVRSPIDGIVAAKFVDQYGSVQPKSLAFRIHDLREFTVAIDLPQALVLATQRRAAASDGNAHRFTAHFSHPAAAGAGYPLTISSFSSDPDPRTGTYRFELNLPGPDGLVLLPGMSCTVRITANSRPGQVLVPTSAVTTNADRQPVVWVMDEAGRAQPREVTLGELHAGGQVVTAGLQNGEVIITAGLNQLRPGLPVRSL
jgi:membrane fusion protein, multidrug efflux system